MSAPDTSRLQALLLHACHTHPGHFTRLPQLSAATPVSGGDTHRCYHLHAAPQDYFLKLASSDHSGLLQAEARGLHAIAATATIATCVPLAQGEWQGLSYLLLPWLSLSGDGNWRDAGRQLAAMHLCPTGSNRYGFDTPAWCGGTPQPAEWDESWARFFARQRIGHQLSLLYGQPITHKSVATPAARAEELLQERQPLPALLHGDLWSGNIGFAGPRAVIFDPASYYGDPETDLAMTELFGRLPPEFYEGYAGINPIEPGYPQRRRLYQLYHLLNHANLFGGGYLQQAERELRQLLT